LALIQLGGSPLPVQFDPGRRHTVVSASVGARIAGVPGGYRSSPGEQIEIASGVRNT